MRRPDQLSLLGRCDGFQRGAVRSTGTITDFDKDQRLSIAHDEIGFTAADVLVAGDHDKTLSFKPLRGQRLDVMTALAIAEGSKGHVNSGQRWLTVTEDGPGQGANDPAILTGGQSAGGAVKFKPSDGVHDR